VQVYHEYLQFILDSCAAPPSLPTEEADKLSVDMQQELCKLLDPMHAGKDVYALAEKLGYNQIVDGLEAVELTGTSPTQFLLNYHEVSTCCQRCIVCAFVCGFCVCVSMFVFHNLWTISIDRPVQIMTELNK